MQKSTLVMYDGPSFEALIFDAVDRAIKNNTPVSLPINPVKLPPITSKPELQAMTGWPNGTLYAKVAEMPEGVVIRGRSKRLLFDTEKLLIWLKTPVKP